MRKRAKTALSADFSYRMVCGKKQIFGILEPEVGHILSYCEGGFGVEELAYVVR